MSKRDRKNQRKAKRRRERIRQQKHARQFGAAVRDDEFDELPAEPRPDYATERLLRVTAWATKERSFASFGDLQRFTDSELNGHGWKEHHARMLLADTREQAQEYAYQAHEADDDAVALDLARKALGIDPTCLDARVALVVFEESFEDRPRLIDEAIAQARLTPAIADAIHDRNGKAWDRVRARPFIRALLRAFYWHAEAGDLARAIAYGEEITGLDQACGDVIGDDLLACRLRSGRLAEARAQLDRRPDDERPLWIWARILERLLSQDRAGARRLVDIARNGDARFEDLLVSGSPGLDAPAEQWKFLETIGRAWQAHAEAKAWLAEDCRLTTESEREASLRSYRPPVDRLLQRGEAGHGRDVAERTAIESRLSQADVPELLRMADDQALHELDRDHPAIWAPVHAIRAVSHLGAQESVPALFALLPRRQHDEWMSYPMMVALAGVGRPAVETLRTMVGDRSRSVGERMFATESLDMLAERHPELRAEAIAILVGELERHASQPKRLTSFLMGSLAGLRAIEAETLIRNVFACGDFDEDFIEPLPAVLEQLHGAPEVTNV
jgi:hypothetical protein